jgi:hypothetical protein
MRRISLLVPGLALAAAASIPVTGTLGPLGLTSSSSVAGIHAGSTTSTTAAAESSAKSSAKSTSSAAAATTAPASPTATKPGDTTEPAIRRIDLDCFDQNHLTDAQHPAGTDPIRCNWAHGDRDDFGSFQLSRQVAGSTTPAQVVFTTTDKAMTTFLDTTATKGVKYVYTLKELNKTGAVIGQSKPITPSMTDDRDDSDAAKPADKPVNNKGANNQAAGKH